MDIRLISPLYSRFAPVLAVLGAGDGLILHLPDEVVGGGIAVVVGVGAGWARGCR